MLELIVLGQIPGTSFQITFGHIATFSIALLMCLYGAREIDSALRQKSPTTKH